MDNINNNASYFDNIFTKHNMIIINNKETEG